MLIIQIILTFIIPYFLIRLSELLKIENILSPVVLCYALGLLIRIVFSDGFILKETTDILTQGTIALAIPLILMTSDFKAFIQGSKTILLSFALAIFSVFIVCLFGAFIFKSQTDDSAAIAGMLAGVYSGGTPNMAAIKTAINADENLYGALNIAEILMGGIYLVFLTSIGPRVFRFLLPSKNNIKEEELEVESSQNNWNSLSILTKLKQIIPAVGLAMLSITIAIGFSLLSYGEINDSLFIILITLFGIAISFLPFRKYINGAYETGDYLLLVFSLALGMMSNFSDILTASPVVIYFTAFIILGTISLHLLLARIFKIDADTTLITSAACIFGPVFIGQIVSVLKNRSMLVPGMAMGVTGIALGSFLGIFIYHTIASIF